MRMGRTGISAPFPPLKHLCNNYRGTTQGAWSMHLLPCASRKLESNQHHRVSGSRPPASRRWEGIRRRGTRYHATVLIPPFPPLKLVYAVHAGPVMHSRRRISATRWHAAWHSLASAPLVRPNLTSGSRFHGAPRDAASAVALL